MKSKRLETQPVIIQIDESVVIGQQIESILNDVSLSVDEMSKKLAPLVKKRAALLAKRALREAG